MATTTVDGRFVECNQRFEDDSGYSRAELAQVRIYTYIYIYIYIYICAVAPTDLAASPRQKSSSTITPRRLAQLRK